LNASIVTWESLCLLSSQPCCSIYMYIAAYICRAWFNFFFFLLLLLSHQVRCPRLTEIVVCLAMLWVMVMFVCCARGLKVGYGYVIVLCQWT
jgi:hypothetical protein